jgi:hypothetical protein
MNDEFAEIDENLDLAFLAHSTMRTRGPHLKIVHNYHLLGSDCLPGEQIAALYLTAGFRDLFVRVSCTSLLLVNYLAHNLHTPQTAAQITAGINSNPFYKRHGTNAGTNGRFARAISYSCVKEYVRRIRIALGRVLREGNVRLDPVNVLHAEKTSSNTVTYRLHASVEWIHIDHPASQEEG